MRTPSAHVWVWEVSLTTRMWRLGWTLSSFIQLGLLVPIVVYQKGQHETSCSRLPRSLSISYLKAHTRSMVFTVKSFLLRCCKVSVLDAIPGNSLEVQWSGHGVSTAVGWGSVSGRGTKIPQERSTAKKNTPAIPPCTMAALSAKQVGGFASA